MIISDRTLDLDAARVVPFSKEPTCCKKLQVDIIISVVGSSSGIFYRWLNIPLGNYSVQDTYVNVSSNEFVI